MDSRNVYSDSMDIFSGDEEKRIKELAIETIDGDLHYLWGKINDLEEEIKKLKEE